MAPPEFAEPVQLFCAVLWADDEAREEAVRQLTARYGEVDMQGPDRPFDRTHYYDDEMGSRLQRRIVGFAELFAAERIADAKAYCNKVEDALCADGGRRVNLDIGYLDHNKVILASCKGAGQKVYLGHGYWADLVGRWHAGRYEPFAWTFPDFRDGRYDKELGQLRQRYLERLKAWRKR